LYPTLLSISRSTSSATTAKDHEQWVFEGIYILFATAGLNSTNVRTFLKRSRQMSPFHCGRFVNWYMLVRTVDAWSVGQLRTLLCMVGDNLYHLLLSIGDTGKNSHEKSSLWRTTLPYRKDSSLLVWIHLVYI
jgi:hypothetical protein